MRNVNGAPTVFGVLGRQLNAHCRGHVDLSARRLRLYRNARLVLSAAVAVGLPNATLRRVLARAVEGTPVVSRRTQPDAASVTVAKPTPNITLPDTSIRSTSYYIE